MDATTAFYDALAPMFDVMTDWNARLAPRDRSCSATR